MLNYATVKDFWLFLEKHNDYLEFTDKNRLWGDLKEYQRLFVLDQLLNHSAAKRLIEVGGGVCNVFEALIKRFPERYECWSIDPLEGQGGGPVLQNVPKNLEGKVNFIREEFGRFSPSIPDNFFDILFSISVMEHIPLEQWENVFLDMVRVVKKGAIIIHTVDVPVDFDLAEKRLSALKELPNKVGLKLLDPATFFEAATARNDPSTYYVSPAAYARWLRHMPTGQNTLSTGIFRRITSFNAIYTKI